MAEVPGSPPQTCSLLIPAHPLLGREENMKLLFDLTMSLNQQAMIDNQINARRRHSNDAAYDHLVSMAVAAALATSVQTGETENQQTVSPGRTGTPEATIDAIGTSAAGIATSNQAVATSLGNLASALVPIVAGTSGVVSVQTLAAVLATVVAAAGASAGTSTSSTTK